MKASVRFGDALGDIRTIIEKRAAPARSGKVVRLRAS
jgi:hypothetical protein